MSEPSGLAAALAKLQTKLPEIKKTERADVQTQKGSYSYTYAGLAGISAQIMPMLGELGLSFIAKPTFHEGRFVLAYSLLHESGEREDGEYPLPTSGTPQSIGSAITYGRRYCLCSVTGVAPEDDDDGATAEAEATAKRGTAQRATTPRRPPASGQRTAQRASATGTPPLPGEDDKPTTAQTKKAMACFNELDVTDRDERLTLTSALVGRDITSWNELTKTEAGTVIDQLEQQLDTKPKPGPDHGDGGQPPLPEDQF